MTTSVLKAVTSDTMQLAEDDLLSDPRHQEAEDQRNNSKAVRLLKHALFTQH